MSTSQPWTFFLLSGLFVLASLFCGATCAADVKTHAMSIPVYKKLNEANELVDVGNMEEAIALITELQERRLSKYERAQTWYMLGSWHFRSEKEDKALLAFTKVLEGSGKIPLYLEANTLKTLTQMHMVKENFALAKEYCLRMLALTEAPRENDYVLLAQTLYKLSEWSEALEAIHSAKQMAANINAIPAENTFILENAIHFERNDFENMVVTLQELIKYYPKATYLLYLASIYGQQEQPEKQTVLMESLYENNHLMQSSQLTTLASLYLSANVPVKAAMLLENSLQEERIKHTRQHYEMLSQAWQLAAELPKAIIALEQAAQKSTDGELYIRKARMEFHSLQWQATTQSVMMGLDKGIEDEETKGDAWLLYGMALFNQQQFDLAIEACQKAAEFEATRSFARQWINYISSEKEKYDSFLALN